MSENAAEAPAVVTYDFVCDRPRCGFTSVKWDTQALADERGAQHYEEHDTGIAMPEIHVFRVEHGMEEPAEWVEAQQAAHAAEVAAYKANMAGLAAAIDAPAPEGDEA